jgi:sporulation protein YlmC with PRC-barrel domain
LQGTVSTGFITFHRSATMGQSQAFSSPPIKASSVIGTEVVNPNDEALGDIKEMVIDPSTGKVAYAVVAFGGFMGLGQKLVAIPFAAFSYNMSKNEYVLDVPKDRLKEAPSFDAGHWPSMTDEKWNRDQHSYYGRIPYWE